MNMISSGSGPVRKQMSVEEIQSAVHFLEDSLSHQIPTKTYGVATEVFRQMSEKISKGHEGMQILKATAHSIMTKEDGVKDFKEAITVFISDPNKRGNLQFHACLQAFRQLEMPVDTIVSQTISENQNMRTNISELVNVYEQIKSSMGPQFGQYLVMTLCYYEDANAAITALLARLVQQGVKNLLSIKEPREVTVAKRIQERKRLPEKTELLLKKMDPSFDLGFTGTLSDKAAVKMLFDKLQDEKAYRLYVHFIIEESLGIK